MFVYTYIYIAWHTYTQAYPSQIGLSSPNGAYQPTKHSQKLTAPERKSAPPNGLLWQAVDLKKEFTTVEFSQNLEDEATRLPFTSWGKVRFMIACPKIMS